MGHRRIIAPLPSPAMDSERAGTGYLALPDATDRPGDPGAARLVGPDRPRARRVRRSSPRRATSRWRPTSSAARSPPSRTTPSASSPPPTPTSWPTSPGPASRPCATCPITTGDRSACSGGRWVRRWRCGWRPGCPTPSPPPPSTTAARTSTWSTRRSAFLGHYAERRPYVDEDDLVLLESELHLDGLEVEFHRYPGTRHWFAEPDRPEHDRGRRRAGLGPHPRRSSPPPPAGLTHDCVSTSSRTSAPRAATAMRHRQRSAARGLAAVSLVEGGAEGGDAGAEVLGAGAVEPLAHQGRRHHHAVGVLGGGDGLLGRGDAEAHDHRQVGGRLQALGQHGGRVGQLAALAGDAEQVHAVDEALRARAQPRQPLVGRERRGELDGGQAGVDARTAPTPPAPPSGGRAGSRPPRRRPRPRRRSARTRRGTRG